MTIFFNSLSASNCFRLNLCDDFFFLCRMLTLVEYCDIKTIYSTYVCVFVCERGYSMAILPFVAGH